MGEVTTWMALAAAAALSLMVPSGAVEAYELQDAARETGFGPNLIRSIALEESRTVDRRTGETRPWPWVLRAQDRAMFFDTRREAERALRELRYQGVRNIDIGAMQINARWNGHLAEKPEDLLDPAVNLWAFTQVIRECQSRLQTVPEVVACYHTGRGDTPRGVAYAKRVMDRYRAMEQGL